MITSSTSAGGTCARSSAARMATSPSVCAGTLDSAPLNEPTGVRAALTMTTSSSFILASTTPTSPRSYPSDSHYGSLRFDLAQRGAAKALVLRTKNVVVISQLRHGFASAMSRGPGSLETRGKGYRPGEPPGHHQEIR